MCKSWTFSIKFGPNYFILFPEIVKEIVFLISFWDFSLLAYRNTLIFIYWYCLLQPCSLSFILCVNYSIFYSVKFAWFVTLLLYVALVKNLPAVQETRFDPWVRIIPWKRKWQPTSVLLPGESHGQRSLASCSPWGCKSRTRLSD